MLLNHPNALLASFLSAPVQQQVSLLKNSALLIEGFNYKDQQLVIYYYYGYYVEGGALEIGRASTTAVVVSCILILFADYGLSVLLL